MVSLTFTRWPLYVITHASGDLDLHHQQGRHRHADPAAQPEGCRGDPLRRLVKEALRMRPSRLVVDEVRQEGCLDLTQSG